MSDQLTVNQLTKVCSRCQIEKPFSDFHKRKAMKSGVCSECKNCRRKIRKQQHFKHKEENNIKSLQYYYEHKDEIALQKQQRYLENPEKYKQLGKVNYWKHKEKCNQRSRQHYQKNKTKILRRSKQWHSENPEYSQQHSKQWRSKNPEKRKQYAFKKRDEFNEQAKNRRKTDFIFRVITGLRSRMYVAYKSQGVKKTMHIIDLLGCTKEVYQGHLQSHFKPGMTLENNKKRKWVQHHPIEINSVDLSDPEQLKKVCHYTNVIPMWEDEHIEWHKNHRIRPFVKK